MRRIHWVLILFVLMGAMAFADPIGDGLDRFLIVGSTWVKRIGILALIGVGIAMIVSDRHDRGLLIRVGIGLLIATGAAALVQIFFPGA